MRTVKTKKELIKAIEDGEKNINIDSPSLYAACKLAEEFNSATELLKHYGIQTITSAVGSFGTMNIVVNGTVVVVTITIAVLVTAIAIIGICKDKRVKIKTKDGKGREIEIEVG